MYPMYKEDWKKSKEYSQEVDNFTNNYGVMPTSRQIQEMPKFKGITHQRRENVGTPKINQYYVITPHDLNDILDMGVWFLKVKVSIPATEVIKIPAQQEKMMKVLTPTPPKKITF